MSQNIKIATYNCENLFSRTRIFRENKSRSLELLAWVAKLQEELTKPVFDQNILKTLKNDLKGYVIINDIRNKHDKPGIGANEWFGWMEFQKEPANAGAIKNLAQVITDVDADIICLIEVENRPLLQKFHDDILYKHYLKPAGKKKYEHIMLIDGNDDRGIDVSIMSRLPINLVKSYIDDTTKYMGKTVKTFSRDCLHVQLDIKADKPLNIFINHLKSQGYSDKNDPQGNKRRLGQAERVVDILKNFNLKKDYVVVAGDLNADPGSASLAPLVNHNDLYNLNLKLPPDERGTYQTGKKQFDYLLVSQPLEQNVQNISIERRGIYSKKYPHYPGVTGKTTEASDHAAVF